jgi:hypothetical protein
MCELQQVSTNFLQRPIGFVGETVLPLWVKEASTDDCK